MWAAPSPGHTIPRLSPTRAEASLERARGEVDAGKQGAPAARIEALVDGVPTKRDTLPPLDVEC